MRRKPRVTDDCTCFLAILERETPLQDPGHFLELLASSQARRLDDQRVSLSHFPGLRLSTSSPPHTHSTSSTDPVLPAGLPISAVSTEISAPILTDPISPRSPGRQHGHAFPVPWSKSWAAWGRWCVFWHACKMSGETKKNPDLRVPTQSALCCQRLNAVSGLQAGRSEMRRSICRSCRTNCSRWRLFQSHPAFSVQQDGGATSSSAHRHAVETGLTGIIGGFFCFFCPCGLGMTRWSGLHF